MGLHMSISHVFYPPREPRNLSLSSNIGNNTPFLGLFQDRLYEFYGLAWCNILPLLQLQKGPALHYLQKGFKYTYPVPALTAKGTLLTKGVARNFCLGGQSKTIILICNSTKNSKYSIFITQDYWQNFFSV